MTLLAAADIAEVRAQEGGITIDAILRYARVVSISSSAPEYWQPGMPMVGFLPPAPTAEAMRAGAFAKCEILNGKADVRGVDGAEDNSGVVGGLNSDKGSRMELQDTLVPPADAPVPLPERRKSGTLSGTSISIPRPAKKKNAILDLDDLSSSSDSE